MKVMYLFCSTIKLLNMEILGLKHLENILYRELTLKGRTSLIFKWVKEEELTQDEFDTLISYCNEISIAQSISRIGRKQ